MSDFDLDLIESTDFWPLAFLAGIVYYVGQAIGGTTPPAVRLRQCAGYAVLLGYYSLAFKRLEFTDVASIIAVIFRGLLLAAIATGTVGVCYPLWAAIQRPFYAVHSLNRRLWASRRSRILDREQQERQREANLLAARRDHERRDADRLHQAELAARQAEAQAQADRQRVVQEQNQRRREEIIYDCELFYERHREALRESFPAKRLRDYIERYLSRGQPAEQLEQRAGQLREILAGLAQAGRPVKPHFKSLGDVREYYREQQQIIAESDFSEEIKESIVADLAREEARAIREFRQS